MDHSLLQSYSLFGGINDQQLEKVIPYLKEENFLQGDIIIKEGNAGDKIFFITDGSVEVLKNTCTPSGPEDEQLAVLCKGDTFGEMELIDIEPSIATVKALDNTSTLTLSNKDLYDIYHQDMKIFTIIIMNLAREISRRLRKMDALVAASICTRNSTRNKQQ